jgi:hypothetical protein
VTRKGLISLFCVLNLGAVLYANVPAGLATRAQRAVAGLDPQGQACAGCAAWLLGRWAHLTGLGARWQLFGPLPSRDYTLSLTARWPDGTTSRLPTSPWRRTGLLSVLTEHKQDKIDLNLAWNAATRDAWGRSVCRWLAATTGRAPAAVAFTMETRAIVPRAQAAATGVVHGPPDPTQELAVVDCAGTT